MKIQNVNLGPDTQRYISSSQCEQVLFRSKNLVDPTWLEEYFQRI